MGVDSAPSCLCTNIVFLHHNCLCYGGPASYAGRMGAKLRTMEPEKLVACGRHGCLRRRCSLWARKVSVNGSILKSCIHACWLHSVDGDHAGCSINGDGNSLNTVRNNWKGCCISESKGTLHQFPTKGEMRANMEIGCDENIPVDMLAW